MTLPSRKVSIIGAAILVVVIAAIVFMVNGRDTADAQLVALTNRSVVQEVAVSGSVKADQSVDLGFEVSGRVRSVTARTGDRIRAGTVFISLENNQSRADVVAAEARLAEAVRGTRAEELAISKEQVDSARIDFEASKQAFVDSLNTVYGDTLSAVGGYGDTLFIGPGRSNNSLRFRPRSSGMSEKLEDERYTLVNESVRWKRLVSIITEANFETNLSEFDLYFNRYKTFIINLADAVNTAQSNDTTPQATINEYRSVMTTARQLVIDAATERQSAETTYKNAESDLRIAEREYTFDQAGSSVEDIAIERANLLSAQASYEKTIIRASFDGLVTALEVEQGEIVGANQTLVSLISDGVFTIEANIPEVDIAKIAIDNTARVTLDAYGDSVAFDAHVILIDPTASVLDGVPTYKTTLAFVTVDERIRSGMTANVTIVTARTESSLTVPLRAVRTNDAGQTVVSLKQGDTTEERVITLGVRGSDGYAQVTEGLTLGDMVVVPE